MLRWELKKIIKEKSNLIALALMIVLFLQMISFQPMLETQNEYYDEAKNEYIIDNRDKEIIGNENLSAKVKSINMISNLISVDEQSKELNKMSKEKLKLDNGSEYENIDFYKVFSERVDFSFSIMIMTIIVILISSNLYTEEQISNVSPIILCSKNKMKALYSKLAIAILLPIIVYGVYICGAGLLTYIQYGQPLNGDLQAYRITEIPTLIKAMTINQYMLSKMITSILILVGISLMSLLSSFISNNSVKAIGLSVCFIAMGKVLTMFKFLPVKLLALIGIGNYVDVMIGMSKISGFYNGDIGILSKSFDLSNVCISIYIFIVIAGILGNIYCIKKVLNK